MTMAWRLAKGLEKLRAQVNEKWPNRSKDSDGSIGDEAHASRSSDHNPWVKDGAMGVVTGMDITHDPKSGCDSYALAEQLLRIKDPRIKYVISNKKIASGTGQGQEAWKWRPYSGANPHNHHVHISIKPEKASYDSTAPWMLDGIPVSIQPNYVAPSPTLRKGSRGEYVRQLQTLLSIAVDGEFGPKTETAVKNFQTLNKLVSDGVVGPMTWAAFK
jgi:hypothetical protein